MNMEDLTNDPAAESVLEVYKDASTALLRLGAPWVFLPRDALFLTHWGRKAPEGGAWAEVGVFAGLSARILCACKGERPIYLFDTFGGLPYHEAGDVGQKGDFNWPRAKLEKFLSDQDGVHIVEGLFPESAAGLNREFTLAHLDADTYRTTTDGLNFFWPRMPSGGVIVVHDVHDGYGPGKAVEDFCGQTKTVEYCGTQAAVIKA